MDQLAILKAIADETRMGILKLLLEHNHCVRALARKLGISEAAVSQHLKILREAGLVTGEKEGYFMHYEVNRAVLHGLAANIEALACVEREVCRPVDGGCRQGEYKNCHNGREGSAGGQGGASCHGAGHPHHSGECRCKNQQGSED